MVVWIEIVETQDAVGILDVTTCVVVWIEMPVMALMSFWPNVTTCVVVWIEISSLLRYFCTAGSPPAWWCGLKSQELR